ncbi:849a3b60-9fcd-4f96-9347-ff08453b0835 [Sclerotinia trifoliorum]|uniref:849a3b60-9fcd-4f96-9347-ff08453b0835 n=1 Tax=Sclerotinia trifoliorum TaxID=28548 RepID=A0A8H2VZ77_9HELO|nr:849a3b60-9fcd-4f96-9347-ff08453b0835 [Sclerotinia trifoliorum]
MNTIIQPNFKGELPRQSRVPIGQHISIRGDWLKPVKSSTSQQIRLLPTSSNLEEHPYLRGPTKVIADDNTICYYKEFPAWLSPLRTVTKEKPWIHIQISAAIDAKKLRSDIHVCRLHSVIIDDDREVLQHWPHPSKEDLYNKWGRDGGYLDWTGEQYADPNFSMKRLVGILLYYIDNKGTLEEVAPQSDDEHRYRWATELENIVGELHTAGLVWGDAKPSNLLIDRNDQLWLIDLEGSYTPRWVDEDNRDSQEGNLQGVERIKKWLAKCNNKSTDCIGFGKNE